MTEEHTASFKIYFAVPRFRIAYKNKRDLFEAFQKKMKELNLDIDNITCADWDGDRSLVNTPDDLFDAVDDYSAAAFSSSEEEEEERKENGKNEGTATKQCRSRPHSCDCRRARSFSCDGSYEYPTPQSFYTTSPLVDPCFPCVPFDAAEQPYRHMSSFRPEKLCRSKNIKCKKRRHCRCERLTRD
ncbi:unnamed protein product [Cylicocyclus nassatus]|uniref:Uncharacterized protein n=1 Tax=Cylicocyclus nassatus TaxID=53992 RepID=A0AA36GI46_CYLNA|nr:unnamed protein product [Cylicocyclus nassatus]